MLLWTLAVLAVGMVALLSVPVELVFDVRRKTAWHASLRVVWFFGVVNFPVTADESKPKRKPKSRPKPAKKKGSGSRWWRVVLDSGFRRRVIRFARDALVALRPRDLWLRLRLGLDDPAETGMLWAFVGPLTVWTPARLDVAPVFPGPAFEMESHGRIRIIPAQILGLTAGFALSPATLSAAFRQWRRA